MKFGAVPLALQFAISVASWMVKSRIGAAAAAEQAAAEFDYFKRVSDAELTQIAFEMARKFPQYPYYEWFRILQDLREYGVFTPGEQAQAPGGIPEPPPEDKDKDKKGNVWIFVAVGVLAFVVLSEG